jgi:hypothetical protein
MGAPHEDRSARYGRAPRLKDEDGRGIAPKVFIYNTHRPWLRFPLV